MIDKKILIIIPAYNEAENIKKTIEEVRALQPHLDILVIDDGSSDHTAINAKAAGVSVVSLPFNLGIGAAVQTGLQYAFYRNYDIVVRVDADGQHDVQCVPALIDFIESLKADIVIGSRFVDPSSDYRSSFVRRIGIQFFAHLISFLTRCKITDPTSGFNAFNKKGIKIFAQDYPYDFPEPESIVIAQRAGLKIVEIPVKMRKRLSGHSSIRYCKTLYYMIKVTFAILLDMIKTRREIL